MFKIVGFVCCFLFLSSCANVQYTPISPEKLTYEKIHETKNTKEQNFNAAASLLAKKINNSNHAIRLKDLSSGKIVAKIGYACKIERPDLAITIGWDGITPLDVTTDLSFKENKVKFDFKIETFRKTVSGLYGATSDVDMMISSGEKQEKLVQECLSSLDEFLLKGLEEEQSKSEW